MLVEGTQQGPVRLLWCQGPQLILLQVDVGKELPRNQSLGRVCPCCSLNDHEDTEQEGSMLARVLC